MVQDQPMTTTVKTALLVPGQVVGLANCVTAARVVSRVKNGLYRVDYKGQEIEMRRNMLSVIVLGEFRFGAVSADGTESKYPLRF